MVIVRIDVDDDFGIMSIFIQDLFDIILGVT